MNPSPIRLFDEPKTWRQDLRYSQNFPLSRSILNSVMALDFPELALFS